MLFPAVVLALLAGASASSVKIGVWADKDCTANYREMVVKSGCDEDFNNGFQSMGTTGNPTLDTWPVKVTAYGDLNGCEDFNTGSSMTDDTICVNNYAEDGVTIVSAGAIAYGA